MEAQMSTGSQEPLAAPLGSKEVLKRIDLQAVIAEELEQFDKGTVSDQVKQNSILESAKRARSQNRDAKEPDDKLPTVWPSEKFNEDLHKREFSALCLSEGGIRSATFGLGLIQALAKANLLTKFHYLSTVSGGGYIGSWLTSWAKRHPGGIQGVVNELKTPPAGKKVEPDPVWHLRLYTAYLDPRVGILSADTWTLIATYVRNLLLNWLILIPMFWVLVLTPKIGLMLAYPDSKDRLAGLVTANLDCAVVLALGIGCFGLLIGKTYVFVALAKKMRNGPRVQGADTTKFAARSRQRFLLIGLLPLMLAALAFPLAWSWHRMLPPDSGFKIDLQSSWLLSLPPVSCCVCCPGLSAS
jgi:hypothetical protein